MLGMVKGEIQPGQHAWKWIDDILMWQDIYRVGQIKLGHSFQLITSEVLLGSSLFLAENKAI